MLETSRLILRQWEAKDRAPFAALNADSDVMRFFPAPLQTAESDNLADRFSEGIAARGWGLRESAKYGVAGKCDHCDDDSDEQDSVL